MNSPKTSLIIFDGFGIWKKSKTNAIYQANTPHIDKLFANKYTKIWAHGEYVGLSPEQIGNSEVGHITIGAGRILKQTKVKIDELFTNKEFENNLSYKKTIKHVRENNSTLQIMTLFSNGWVHAYDNHLRELIKILPNDIQISLHLFWDGRDVPPRTLLWDLEIFQNFLQEQNKNIIVSSVSGRFFAMDRDNNWERIKQCYEAITWVWNKWNITPIDSINESYQSNKTDEFIDPILFENGKVIKENDAIFFLNFRSDRARQITQAFTESNFEWFKRNKIHNLLFTAMTKAYPEYKRNIILENEDITNTLWEVLSKNNKTQLHISETEKFAHVTKFFNGWKQIKFPWETDILIPSKKTESFDLVPEMSANEIFEAYEKHAPEHDFTVVNYANWDMVWHTGNLEATIKTVEKLDEIVGKTIALSKEKNMSILFTADHGNCEEVGNKENPHTAHTTNKVPLWYIENGEVMQNLKEEWWLANLAPTVLDIMWIERPKEMNQKSLIIK